MKLQYRPREDRIETAIRLPSSKRAIDASVVDLRAPILVLFNRQFLPLTADVQQLQDVTKEAVQGELRRRSPGSNAQVRQDKLPELLEAQFRRNALPLLTFRHFGPQEKGTVGQLRRWHPKSSNPRILQANPISLKTRNQ